MSIYDVKRKTYRLDIPFLINTHIYEYDIAKANLNILYAKGVVNDEQYREIMNYGRGQREIYFGNLSKNKEIAQILADGLVEYRELFIKVNQIKNSEILSVKNDAFFIMKKAPITKFNNIEFKLKNTYTSYFFISKLEIYYLLDLINNREVIDVKGINDDKLLYHQDYFILFLCSVFEAIQTSNIENCIKIVQQFYTKYINKELPYGYYREFNSDSGFRISFPNGMQWMSNSLDDKLFEFVNIGYNLNIIREIYSILNILYSR